MSMTRSTVQELCDFVQQNPATVLGNKFFDSRLVLHVEASAKSDKFESRILVLSKFRVFFLSGKAPGSLKVEKSFHLLSIKALQVVKEDELSITFEENLHRKKIVVKSSTQTGLFLSKQILSALKHYFPDIGSQLATTFEIAPTSLLGDFETLPIDVAPRPCHSFRRTYAALCDFYEQPYREEVSWDVEKIYTINKLRDLRIDDFSHLLPRDLLPIVGVLQYSAYFSGLIADGVRIPPEVIDVILSVVRKSNHLQRVQLRNCALPKDFVMLFASALQNSSTICLESLDLSKNVLDDKKGFGALSLVLPRMPTLRHLNVSECQLSEKCVQLLCAGLYNGVTACKGGNMQLSDLVLSSNVIREDVSSLINLISLCTSLRVLDLTDTGFPLEKIWPALKYGGLQIEKLLLGGCFVAKKAIENLQAVKEYFSMAVNLSQINFNNTTLPSEFLKNMLLGLASNRQLKPFRLDLDNVSDKGSPQILEACLGSIQCESLSLRDNNLEADLQGILQSLLTVPCLRRLDIGGANFSSLKRSGKQSNSSTINKILLDVVKLYSDESSLEELIVSECRLGAFLSVLMNTLGATTSLKILDVSSNEMGNFGARILSKALQVNVSLRTILIDNNHIGADGFVDIANAMRMNYTLTNIPYPVHDSFECMQRAERPRAISALSQIQQLLFRNRTSASFEEANCKRIHAAGLQQLLEKASEESFRTVNGSVFSFSNEPFPSRLNEIVEDFVEQFRREASLCINESLPRATSPSVNFDSKRAEQFAGSRLNELWVEDAKHVFSDWRWREFCDRSEFLLKSNLETSSVDRSSLGNASPAFPAKRSEASYRPRSIIGEIAENGEVGVSLDAPPKPSPLQHLQKSRPRRRGQGSSPLKQVIVEDVMLTSRSTEAEGDDEVSTKSTTESEDGADGDKPAKNEHITRIAMIPDPSLLAQVQLKSPTDRAAANLSPDSPPPLPQRNRPPPGAQPPSLPPKPEPRARTTIPAAEDDENANSRRSVADMTPLFMRENRSTPTLTLNRDRDE
ncbi:unnamed protein product [Caenorhabditis auriculariae]|uniref:CARMIL pleckstrin homology domain-containing protein n=1 Tax=Caenorhabditis auriculariae TaxID=2777116 RepID=A0A8S1GNG0_9PELO|nr:unnamed protein product [Caenorhabditis auriculariae]